MQTININLSLPYISLKSNFARYDKDRDYTCKFSSKCHYVTNLDDLATEKIMVVKNSKPMLYESITQILSPYNN